MTKLIAIFPCLLLCGFAYCGPEGGKVASATGNVSMVKDGSTQAVKLKRNDKVFVGSTIKTGRNSKAVLVLTPRSAIRMSSNSEIYIEDMSENVGKQKVLLSLRNGSIGALLKPNASKTLDFRVKTPSGIAAAKGTFFSVVVEDGKGYTQVKEGKVDIIPLGEEEEDGGARAAE